MKNELHKRSCVPCRGDTPILNGEELLSYKKKLRGSWIEQRGSFGNPNSIVRHFAFKNFDEALAFFNKVAEIAKKEDHHPDMSIYNYRNVEISLTTHAAKGLTANDFIMAAKIDKL